MKLKNSLLGTFFMVFTISAVIIAAPTRANIGTIDLVDSKSPKVWQILNPENCPVARQPRKRTNISRLRNDSCPKISR
ncbi:hypothetical protein NIES4071_99270 [Calothrix sp. NIES-4071]|nr:hypothetical protein NIES4071_99270 [Calothrix sp. NIES-4071]BAZ64190.1 hypothetical protein NIES4105_99200 [Calothrix sp. NIES-4105]